ncbi:DUF971 domain-containing protein [Paraburkholderia rhynchosiae]|uniref:Gamma-butyrobetaine hydroxylase-like N-terminal domain-containing protein n=1 Tax=Paraburkholderia rhynchosiae TaxID=487049 RepID=A0A2N7WIP3_9BURK|nr:gamma-butyrobetaine hydroxylase-like domain-containing protein [Paraburkholderia rhynchosiae]PMS29165.1 hypothetical protein C0Z16_20610 [Paraburkholderia rhynchosiae]CAB3654674.1 hypothetical protein LMG27174_01340 [Paraburkholderia rhynchosiae]
MNVPEYVAIDPASAALLVHWPDGTVGRLPFAELRSACMCAQCRKRKLDGRAPSQPPNVQLLDARPSGYGLQLVFDDGHERGIFPWTYLERLARGARHTAGDQEPGTQPICTDLDA